MNCIFTIRIKNSQEFIVRLRHIACLFALVLPLAASAADRPVKVTMEELEGAYQTLGLEDRGSGYSLEEIKARFKKLVLKYHPDKQGGNDKLGQKVIAAMNIIKMAR